MQKYTQKGVTLIELMISMFIFAIISTAIYLVFLQSNKAFKAGERQVQASQNARIAMEVMAREIRQATAFSVSSSELTVKDKQNNQIRYYVDSSSVVNQKLHREVIDSFGSITDVVKAEYIKNLTFEYFGNDLNLDKDGDNIVEGTEIASYDSTAGDTAVIDRPKELEKVTLIRITVEVDTDMVDTNSDGIVELNGPKNMVLQSSVQLRNLKLF